MPTKTVVTGTLQDAGGTLITGGTVVFTIANGQSEQQYYRVTDTAALVPNVVNATISSLGQIQAEDGVSQLEIWGNDTISPSNSWYRIKFFPNGGPDQTTDQVLIQGVTYDLNNPTFYDITSFVADQPPVDVERIQSNIIPITTGQYTLGNDTKYFASLYVQQIFADTITSASVQELTPQMFGIVGGGVVDEAANWALCMTYVRTTRKALHIPGVSGGYRCDTPWDLHDTDAFYIYGDGMTPPSFTLVFQPPTTGSVIFSHVGVGKPFVDMMGANGGVIRDLTFSSLNLTTPATLGIICGTSDRSDLGAPGSFNNTFERIAMYLPQASVGFGTSIGIWGHNINLSRIQQLSCICDIPICLDNLNVHSVTAPFGSIGPAIDGDGNTIDTCTLLTYDTPGCMPMFLKHANELTVIQTYMDTIFSGPTYSGYPFGIYMEDCSDVNMRVEIDYFPSAIQFAGACRHVTIGGVIFPWLTPIPVNVPIIAYFNGTAFDHIHLSIYPIESAAPNVNYFYSTNSGALPVLQHIRNSSFIFDNTISPNTVYWNANAVETTPFWSNRLEGDGDATNTILINGAAAAATKYRLFINSLLVGTG